MVIGGIVAGGTGSRMDSDMPKQFLELGEKPVIVYPAETFLQSPVIDAVVIGVHPDWMDAMEGIYRDYLQSDPRIRITAGGEDRNATVRNMIQKAKAEYPVDADTIFVTHDAARPFVTAKIIEENVRMAQQHGVCGTVIPATDTVIRSAGGQIISEMPPRSEMYQEQTPQTFRYGLYEQACTALSPEEIAAATDVCKLFFLQNLPVYLVKGSTANFKITYPEDLETARCILERI